MHDNTKYRLTRFFKQHYMYAKCNKWYAADNKDTRAVFDISFEFNYKRDCYLVEQALYINGTRFEFVEFIYKNNNVMLYQAFKKMFKKLSYA